MSCIRKKFFFAQIIELNASLHLKGLSYNSNLLNTVTKSPSRFLMLSSYVCDTFSLSDNDSSEPIRRIFRKAIVADFFHHSLISFFFFIFRLCWIIFHWMDFFIIMIALSITLNSWEYNSNQLCLIPVHVLKVSLISPQWIKI